MGDPYHEELLCRAGVQDGRGDAALGNRLAYLARKGRLERVLPGIYIDPDTAGDPWSLAVAAMAFDAHLVVTGTAAAALSYWPSAGVGTIDVANGRLRGRFPKYRFSRRIVPADQVVLRRGVRVTAPAVTAVDLAGSTNGRSLDEVLRAGSAHPRDLELAMQRTSGRVGNPARRLLVGQSRHGAISELERIGHRALLASGIDGWVANEPYQFGEYRYWPDVRFKGRKLILEFDGFEFHSSLRSFVRDRFRWRQMTLNGWLVLPFSWQCLRDEATFVAEVKQGWARAPIHTSGR